jgi:3-hydroxybutyryl-CoA dehydrogenase
MKVGVIGCGVMGRQLTKLLHSFDFDLLVLTRNIDKTFQDFDNKVNRDDFKKPISLINFTDQVSEIAKCQIIFECLPEKVEIKVDYFNQISEQSNSIIASCTSTLTLANLSANLINPSRLQIAHFSNPMSKLKLVEVVLAENISRVEQDLFISVLNILQRKIVFVPDYPGFVLNRLFFPYLKEALNLKVNCKLSTDDIDEVMKTGCNFPLGPFATMKLIGASTAVNVFESLGIILDKEELNLLNSL